jgi:photosynthetic reaction center H subunit
VRDGALKVLFPAGGTRPKTFLLAHEGPHVAAHEERDLTGLLARTGNVAGNPFLPTGDLLQDGVGTASYALRADVPENAFFDGKPNIVPLRAAEGFTISADDDDPRGWEVLTAEREVVGTLVDLWVDRAEVILRYLEAEVTVDGVARRVVFPMGEGSFNSRLKQVKVDSLFAAQFRAAPGLQHGETITLREEDRVSGYFAGGRLYAAPGRAEPIL